jgi:hypothetical protein
MTSPDLGTREGVLEEIRSLLKRSGAIDEARAKKVRKAAEGLGERTESPGGEADEAAIDSGLDAEIRSGLENLRARVHKQVERRNREYEKALGLITELETALAGNELQQAERAHNRLLSLMGNVADRSGQRWRDIDRRLQTVRPQLRKLESWRHWGTTLARQELIDQVMKLKDAGLQPEQLAKQVQQARDQWHAWDKSGDHAGRELWKTFDRACEEAYRPCIEYFEKLKKRRTENLARRRAIIEKLNARYAETDWKQPDWREIDKFVHQARRDFQKIGNVDYRHRKPVARAMDEAIEQFEAYLSHERDRSRKVRERLIDDIEALAEVENLHEALDRLERLRRQWRVTVVGKREQENRLWNRFQAACDLTYQRRDAQRREQDAERKENLKRKEALIRELDNIAAATDGDLLENASALARLRDQWERIGWVPRKQENSLNGRWKSAQKRFRDALQAAQARASDSALDNLARHAALCHQWEQAVQAGNEVSRDRARAEWEALPALSAQHSEALNRRFSVALERPDEAALARNLADKLTACLKLEVLLELDSPPEFQAERMAYQIERLNASMKNEIRALDSPEALLLEAYATGAVPADVTDSIQQRLDACFTKLKQSS